MYLFLVLSAPAAFVALSGLDQGPRSRSSWMNVAQGAGAALPSLLAPAVLRAVLPSTRHGLSHYAALAAVDHLALHAAATGWWLAIRGYRTLEDEAGRRRWNDFFAFSCGFYGLAAAALAAAQWRQPDAYAAFMLPALRLAIILFSSLLMVLYFESYGVFRAGYAAAYVGLPFAAALPTYLERTHHAVAAAAAAVGLVAAALFAWWRKERF